MKVIVGDVAAVLPTLAVEGFDACLCDPPYGLKFMGKAWDHGVPGPETWRHVLAALKPGSPLIAFGGTRTYHRLACAIEDAGFEIRDSLCWLYGQGFPKSLDVSKAIDKAAGAERPVTGIRVYGDGHVQNSSPDRLRPPIGTFHRAQDGRTVTAAATAAAAAFSGYGTALKPAFEPIVLAMKPLDLCEWLARLILPPARDTPRRLLVPFSGSGSEMIGALLAGWDEVVGIELSPGYAEIARARIAEFKRQKFGPLFVEESA